MKDGQDEKNRKRRLLVCSSLKLYSYRNILKNKTMESILESDFCRELLRYAIDPEKYHGSRAVRRGAEGVQTGAQMRRFCRAALRLRRPLGGRRERLCIAYIKEPLSVFRLKIQQGQETEEQGETTVKSCMRLLIFSQGKPLCCVKRTAPEW